MERDYFKLRVCVCVTAGNELEESTSPASLVGSISRGQGAVNAPKVSRPDGDQIEGEEDTSQLKQKVKHLERKFEDLLNAASDDLEKRGVSVRKIRRSLRVRRATDVTDIEDVAGHQEKIQNANTVDDLFDVLSLAECWSFLNTGLLERIIDDHCMKSQGIQHQKKEYLKKLQTFRKETRAKQFAKVCNASNQNLNFSEVVFKMKEGWNGTLEDVENVRRKVLGQEFLHGHVFNFKRPKNSSLSLVWAFPRSCPIETTILRIPPSFYLEHGIRSVLIEGVFEVDLKVTHGMGKCAFSMKQQIPLFLHSLTLRRSRERILTSKQGRPLKYIQFYTVLSPKLA